MAKFNLLFIFLSGCFLFSLISSNPLGFHDDITLPLDALLPSLNAEKLIRALNLHPKDASAVSSNVSGIDKGKKIVEREFRLPGLSGGVPVEDLHHYAGYYRLPHSNDAR